MPKELIPIVPRLLVRKLISDATIRNAFSIRGSATGKTTVAITLTKTTLKNVEGLPSDAKLAYGSVRICPIVITAALISAKCATGKETVRTAKTKDPHARLMPAKIFLTAKISALTLLM